MDVDCKPTVQERYAGATRSSNLLDDAHHHTTDVLAAVALSSDIGSLLMRVKYALDASSYPQLRAAWCEKVKFKADAAHWPTNINPRRVASVTLDYWINDRCPDCNALGFGKFENAPTLTGDVCMTCDGTGTKPLACDNDMRKYAMDALHELECMIIEAGSKAIKKLANKFSL